MGKSRFCFILILVLGILPSCITPSSDRPKQLDKPDIQILNEFGINVNGRVVYQFYQKYGFTDLEEQVILIIEPDSHFVLDAHLPFDSVDVEKINVIDMRKFIEDGPINFWPEKHINADIRLESLEYDTLGDKSVFHSVGTYSIVQTDSVETLYVLDEQSGMMYIESKRN